MPAQGLPVTTDTNIRFSHTASLQARILATLRRNSSLSPSLTTPGTP
jgi:hypothetical protein